METARRSPNSDARDEHQQTVYGLMAMLTSGPKISPRKSSPETPVCHGIAFIKRHKSQQLVAADAMRDTAPISFSVADTKPKTLIHNGTIKHTYKLLAISKRFLLHLFCHQPQT